MFTFSSKGSSHSRMQAQIPHSARCSKYRKCSVSPAVATVPETSTSVESLHTAEYTEKINALIHSTRNPLKRKSINIIHHFRSVQTGIFRSVASLNWKFVPFFEEETPHFPPRLTDIQYEWNLHKSNRRHKLIWRRQRHANKNVQIAEETLTST